MKFELKTTDGRARRGQLVFERGVVQTPAFMPVGTYGTVKAMTPQSLNDIGAQICLGNTFHLWLRPGLEVVKAHKGFICATDSQGGGLTLTVVLPIAPLEPKIAVGEPPQDAKAERKAERNKAKQEKQQARQHKSK